MAEGLLQGNGRRIEHVRAVACRAEQLAPRVLAEHDDIEAAVSAAWVHDVGCASSLDVNRPGFSGGSRVWNHDGTTLDPSTRLCLAGDAGGHPTASRRSCGASGPTGAGSEREWAFVPDGAGVVAVTDEAVPLVSCLGARAERRGDLGPRGASGKRS